MIATHNPKIKYFDGKYYMHFVTTKMDRDIGNANMGNAQKENFKARTVASPPYGHDEVRFTRNGKTLYVFVLNPAKHILSRCWVAVKNRIPSGSGKVSIGSTRKPTNYLYRSF